LNDPRKGGAPAGHHPPGLLSHRAHHTATNPQRYAGPTGRKVSAIAAVGCDRSKV